MTGIHVQRILATRIGQVLKQPARQVIARTGYELVPVVRSETSNTRRLLTSSGVKTLIDVGANQGQFASYMRAMGFGGTILSFEPGTAAYSLLQRHAAPDVLWETKQIALGSSTGSASLNVAKNSVSSSLLHVAAEHLRSAPESVTKCSESVELRRLDDVAQPYPGDVWLKIDTQGYEMEVLLGAEETLKRTAILQLEVSLVTLYENQPDWIDLMGLVRDRGFAILDIIPGFRGPSGDLLQCDVIARRT